MENSFWTALRGSFLAAFVTSMGIYVIRRFEKWGPKNSIYFICFAAGVLISVSFCLYRSGTNQSHRDACIIPVY
jgi:zinc and cadmium transporter